jgi:aconitase A
MTRGTFANVRIKNLMLPAARRAATPSAPTARRRPIYDAADAHIRRTACR